LFLFFLKVGSVLYGSGYVLLAFLRSGLVERLGWLTETQLLDAVAIGQVTPGPVLRLRRSSATFSAEVRRRSLRPSAFSFPHSSSLRSAGRSFPASDARPVRERFSTE
jgi:hypothetical protein